MRSQCERRCGMRTVSLIAARVSRVYAVSSGSASGAARMRGLYPVWSGSASGAVPDRRPHDKPYPVWSGLCSGAPASHSAPRRYSSCTSGPVKPGMSTFTL